MRFPCGEFGPEIRSSKVSSSPNRVSRLPGTLRFDNTSTGNTGSPYGSDRPNAIGSTRLAHPSANEWFHTTAFAIPPPFTFGNAGRNLLIGPGLFTIDVSLARRFALLERVFLTAEAEAFNVLNRANLRLPQAFADEPATFGHILSANAPRQIKLALRLTFLTASGPWRDQKTGVALSPSNTRVRACSKK